MANSITLTTQDICSRTWSLYRPNGDCRSPAVAFGPTGRMIGYTHPNEATWRSYRDGIAFYSHSGLMTSVSGEAILNEAGRIEFNMYYPDSAQATAHVLVETGTSVQVLLDQASRQTAPRSAGSLINHQTLTEQNLNVLTPRAAVRYLSADVKRVYFIANNPELDSVLFEEWDLGSGDIVVQFNTPLYFDTLAIYDCHKVQFHYPNVKSCWGFTEDAQPVLEYLNQKRKSISFAIANGIPRILKGYFENLEGDDQYMVIVPQVHSLLYSYPAGRIPSIGFIAVSFFRYINWMRLCQAQSPLELILVGFSGKYKTGKAWDGHDFAFEQSVYRTWLDLRRI